MDQTKAQRTRFEHANPILNVASVARSVRYYVDVLGFTNAAWASDEFTCVTRDGASIYLSQRSQGQPGTWVWLGVDDVEALHDEYRQSGATILEPPANFAWACEMKVGDPDGHVLRFGSDPKDDARARPRDPEPAQPSQPKLVVFVDVDDTLVRSVGSKRIPISHVVQRVRELHASGAQLTCWSTGGATYAHASAIELGIADCFVDFLAKPQLMVDDQPPADWRNLVCLHPNEISSMTLSEVESAASGRRG
jgi:catechol 2,3-dioxygenase-like lactoylglutathione lyase family enzyme